MEVVRRIRIIARAFGTRENALALLLSLLIMMLLVSTASDAPTWIYQGF